jgi:hypothetical protein
VRCGADGGGAWWWWCDVRGGTIAEKKQHIPNVQAVIMVFKQFILLLSPQIRKKWQYANLSTSLSPPARVRALSRRYLLVASASDPLSPCPHSGRVMDSCLNEHNKHSVRKDGLDLLLTFMEVLGEQMEEQVLI